MSEVDEGQLAELRRRLRIWRDGERDELGISESELLQLLSFVVRGVLIEAGEDGRKRIFARAIRLSRRIDGTFHDFDTDEERAR